MSIATPAFFWFPFAWNIFFRPFTFSLYVSLGLKWVSCRQCIWVLFFVSIQPVCVFWGGAFNLFTFKVIDMYVSITIFLIVLGLFLWVFFFSCFPPREVSLAFVVKLVWWCWILLAFAFLKSFWLLHWIWMRSLPVE